MALTLNEAKQVVEGAIAKAEELGIKINVAVCDGGGRLKAFSRMDGAAWAGMYGSQGKAVASAAAAVLADRIPDICACAGLRRIRPCGFVAAPCSASDIEKLLSSS